MPIQQLLLGSGGGGESDPWGLAFGPTYQDLVTSNIRLDSSRNIIMVSGGGSNTYITKLKNDGTWLWSKRISNVGGNYGIGAGHKRQGLAIDSSDNIYITDEVGYNYSTHNGLRDGDYTLIKFNSSGAIQWQKGIITSYQGNTYGWGTEVGGVETDPSGNVYISGCAYDSTYTKKVFIMKFNSSGTLQWQKELNQGSNVTGGCNVSCLLYQPAKSSYTGQNGTTVEAQNEGVILYGYGTFSGIGGSNSNPFLLKFDVNGNYDWGRVYYHSSDTMKTNQSEETSQLLTQDSSGKLYISGENGGWNSFKCWTAKLEANGDYQSAWAYEYGYTGYVNSAIAIEPTHNYLIEVGYQWTYSNGSESSHYQIRNASNGGLIGKGTLNGQGNSTFNNTHAANQRRVTLDSVVCDDKGHFYLCGMVQNYTGQNSQRNTVLLKLLSEQVWPYTNDQSYVGYNQPDFSAYDGRWGITNGMASGYPNSNPPDSNYWSFNDTNITTDTNRFNPTTSSLTIVTSQYNASNIGSWAFNILYSTWPA